MKRTRRLLGIAVVTLVGLLVALLLVIHLPGVQRAVWERVTASIEEASGWRVESEQVSFRVLPTRFRASNLELTTGGRRVASIENLEATWRWRKVVSAPYRLETLLVDGVRLDLDALPGRSESAGSKSIGPLDFIEVQELRIRKVAGAGSIAETEVVVDGLNVESRLVSGSVTATLSADQLTLDRAGRVFDLGVVAAEVAGSAEGLRVTGLELDSPAVSVQVSGEVSFDSGVAGEFQVRTGVDVANLASWWDPNLATGLQPSGHLQLEGSVAFGGDAGPRIDLEHRGDAIRVAGYDLGEIGFSLVDSVPSVRLAHQEWGRAELMFSGPGAVVVRASLKEAPVDDLLTLAAPRVADLVGRPTNVSGEIDGTLTYPVVADLLAGHFDLVVHSPRGRMAIRAAGGESSWRLEELEVLAAGTEIHASGTVDAESGIDLRADLTSAAPTRMLEPFEMSMPSIEGDLVAGGPLEGEVTMSGPLTAPHFSGSLEWREPEIAGRSFSALTATLSGSTESLDWGVELSLAPGASCVASGWAQPMERKIAGDWEVRADDLAEFVPLLAPSMQLTLSGAVTANGAVAAANASFRVNGEIIGSNVQIGKWVIDTLGATFFATPQIVDVSEISVEAYSGVLTGAISLPVAQLSDPINIDLSWSDLDLAAFPVEVPAAITGEMAGELHLAGSFDRPQGEAVFSWVPVAEVPLLESLVLRGELADGKLSVSTKQFETVSGPGTIRAEIPFGDLPLPEWFWPEAPGGPVSATVRADGVKSGPFLQVLGLDDFQAEAETDLRAEIAWDPATGERPELTVEARDFRVSNLPGELVAEGPLAISVKGERVEIEPFVLAGEGSRLEGSATYDPGAGLVRGRFRARVAPAVANMLPYPVAIDEPIEIGADVQVPADLATAAGGVRGQFTVDHRGGRIVVRDPPVEVRDAHLVVDYGGGAFDITDGTAIVNHGQVDISGGWDPVSGEGVDLEFDGVTVMAAGILSKWNGRLAFEPREDRLAHVSGDMTLVDGVWDERFDVAGFLTADDSTVPEDDLLHDVSLDVVVRGLAGIRVENNLGRFDVNWEQLRVGGTAAEPVLLGEVQIAPGGVLALAGHEVEVRRGVAEFTGDPEIDPVLEIIPAADLNLVGGEDAIGGTVFATQGLAQGLSNALGFENVTLRPAEIAVQTESDPSTRYMVGHRLSHQFALFLATNLSDVQDRLTMIQYWNIPHFGSLALQAYEETKDESQGANVFQRFEWGGTILDQGVPEIRRIRLDGDWPLSKRSLRKATRLRRGQPYDDFLLFVAAVRMERLLAQNGYQNARVIGISEGEESSPVLAFTCEPGERQVVTFEGDALARDVEREVTALYRRPPMKRLSFDKMESVIRQNLVSDGYLAPEISIEGLDEKIVVDVLKGEPSDLRGPFLDGVPDGSIAVVRAVLDAPSELANAVVRPNIARRRVERVLQRAGYLEAQVTDFFTLPGDDGSTEVHLVVDAGGRTSIDSVEILGDDPLGVTEAEALALESGIPLDRVMIDTAVRGIRNTYQEAGYTDVSVASTVEVDASGKRRLQVNLEPGPRPTVREIRFEGRRFVSEGVLSKGVALSPGDFVTEGELNQSASDIANFSPIERATVVTTPIDDSQVDVEFDVVEKDRWTVEVGGGWSTERSFGAAFGIRDDNLFGRGVGLNLRGSLDSKEQKLYLYGSIPPPPGGNLSFISTVGYATGDAPDDPDFLDQDEFLASLEATYRLPNDMQVGGYYRWTRTRTYEKIPDDFLPFDITVRVGTLGLRSVVDRFDFFFDPRKGWGLTSDFGWSGEAIGSELEYLSWLTGFGLALETFAGSTWMQTVKIGIAEPLKGTSLDTEAKFFAGGQSSVRGFDLNTVGPVTYGSDGTLVPAGGAVLFVLNEELRIPVLWDPLRLAIFADVGQVWETREDLDFDFSVGVGIGIRWSTPIGPLWADVAWPVANIGISSTKPKFYLGIGRPF
ncbi:MAG: BamA/TamA family outer membrane protein [Acidobacteria bacterium]|nr:BamA/TamA family outer membrane protein [Acidobacteriota bacterium]